MRQSHGKVFLVGAGPGDPELMTVKAMRVLDEADVVVYDRLVSAEVLALIPAGVSRIFAGKSRRNHHMPQAEINDMLARLARAGHRVVRLKGGDPFVFGRGGEEAEHLAENGIPFEVVPGITAALACTAYAGIPLTHRGLARSVHLLAGHCCEDRAPELDFRSLASGESTIVLYMALANLERIRRGLLDAGMDPQTPSAIIESGTTRAHRCLLSTLDELAERAEVENVVPPALVVIGRVAALAQTLHWFAEESQGSCSHTAHDASSARA